MTRRAVLYAVCLLLALAVILFVRSVPMPSPSFEDSHVPNPLPLPETLFTEEMTWLDVRDARDAGRTTVIIPTGGTEQNGPFVVTGKHNIIVRFLSGRIAEALGNAVVAPVVPFVPEGTVSPPSGHMRFPGTITVEEDLFEELLLSIAESFRVNGFRHFVFIGDSGGNQAGMAGAVKRFNTQYAGTSFRAIHVTEFYDYESIWAMLERRGYARERLPFHDDLAFTLQLLRIEPAAARIEERRERNLLSLGGVSLADTEQLRELGEEIINLRVAATVSAIEGAFGKK